MFLRRSWHLAFATTSRRSHIDFASAANKESSKKIFWMQSFSPKLSRRFSATSTMSMDNSCAKKDVVIAGLFEDICSRWEHSENKHGQMGGKILHKTLRHISERTGVSKSIASTKTHLDAAIKTDPPPRHTKLDRTCGIIKQLDLLWDVLPWKKSTHLCTNFISLHCF